MNTIYTDRLILRPFRKDDAEAAYKNWTYDGRVAEYCRWYPHKSVSETESYLDMCVGKEYCWAITLKDNDEPIGCVDLVGVNSFGVPEIGYNLAYDFWNKGIMTEAVEAAIGELFKNGFEKIGACHRVDNPASGRVMEKCKMKYVCTCTQRKKFASDEECEVKYYEIER